MGTASRSNAPLPDELRAELVRLSRAGLALVPLGGGADGKAPLLGAWAGAPLPLARVLAPLHRTGAQVYGVRLDGLAVIDCDSDDPALVAAMEARFGPSPVHVTTPRGRHLYYRATGPAPNLRAEGVPVDIKTGPRAYVVGPLSVRPDGGTYRPAKGMLGVDALPPLRAPHRPADAPTDGSIPVGHRHNQLIDEGVQMVEYVDSLAELTANLSAVRDDLCADPDSLPDAEVRAIADWVWKTRLEGRIFKGRDSDVRVHRLAIDALRRLPNEADALSLYILLMDLHGHITGKRFALDFASMRSAGLTRLSVPRLRAARRGLQQAGLLMQVGKHRAGVRHQTFMLARLRPVCDDGDIIVHIGKAASRRQS